MCLRSSAEIRVEYPSLVLGRVGSLFGGPFLTRRELGAFAMCSYAFKENEVPSKRLVFSEDLVQTTCNEYSHVKY